MKKAIGPAGAIKPVPKGSAIQQSPKSKAPEKPSSSTFMKKASKPGSIPKQALTRLATNPSAAKPKITAKSSTTPKPRVAEGQAELVQVVAQLAMSAEKLAQAADRLTEATRQKSQELQERQDETFKTLSESIAERTASKEHVEVADVPDLIAPEGTNTTDFTALEQYPGIPEPSEDE
jgi:hypothetical protein